MFQRTNLFRRILSRCLVILAGFTIQIYNLCCTLKLQLIFKNTFHFCNKPESDNYDKYENFKVIRVRNYDLNRKFRTEALNNPRTFVSEDKLISGNVTM
jgi:hypothetical protein